MNKKAEGELPARTMVLLVLMLIAVALGFIVLLSSDKAMEFFRNLPYLFPTNGTPTNLVVKGDVYGTSVDLLINDGEGRCIVTETYGYEDTDDSWLMKYGIRKEELLFREDASSKDWDVVKTNVDRINGDMLEKREIPASLINGEKEIFDDIKDKYYEQWALYNPVYDSDPSSIPGDTSAGDRYSMYKYFVEKDIDFNLDSLDDKDLPTTVKDALTSSIKFFDYSDYDFKLALETNNGKESYFFQSTKDDSFYVKGNVVYKEDGGKLIKVDNGYSPLLYFDDEKVKNQLIKQDLYIECYRNEEKDFKTGKVLGEQVKLLKEDEFGRCLVYESNNPLLEYYSLKKRLVGSQLYILNENTGIWELKKDSYLSEDSKKIKQDLEDSC